jgi:hypothetical protein
MPLSIRDQAWLGLLTGMGSLSDRGVLREGACVDVAAVSGGSASALWLEPHCVNGGVAPR